ncbi:MAG: AAA family ATPase [Candidatus Electrothrix sp. Rat3]|nr:AAA family ATPase [Candidatus Electrothrix rattekaaiensis]
MTKVIALAGKGGTGKTTTSALLLKYLIARKMTPVLAVDADANANLNELVGLNVQTTLGEIRKELKGDMPTGMSRDQYMEMKIHQALIEETGFDLMVMGQPDGPGCYCAANQYLAMTMDKLAENYEYIIVDNEAGMEHLSRMNLRSIDYLFIVSDPSARGIMTARRIADITGPLKLDIKHQYLLVNRAPDPVPPALQTKIDEAIAEADMDLAGIISSSDDLIDQELSGASYLELAEDSKVIEQVFAVFDAVFEDAS